MTTHVCHNFHLVKIHGQNGWDNTCSRHLPLTGYVRSGRPFVFWLFKIIAQWVIIGNLWEFMIMSRQYTTKWVRLFKKGIFFSTLMMKKVTGGCQSFRTNLWKKSKKNCEIAIESWDCKRIIVVDLNPKGYTINAEAYFKTGSIYIWLFFRL